MTDEPGREPAREPQDLERLLISRQWVGNVDDMAALFEPHAVVDSGEGRLTLGREAIRALFAGHHRNGLKICGRKISPRLLSAEIFALTPTRLPDGSVTAEVARRQGDWTWPWVIDRFAVA
ncbi:hypothetical protein ACWTU6_02880 [Mesorhizobium sp. BHbsci]